MRQTFRSRTVRGRGGIETNGLIKQLQKYLPFSETTTVKLDEGPMIPTVNFDA